MIYKITTHSIAFCLGIFVLFISNNHSESENAATPIEHEDQETNSPDSQKIQPVTALQSSPKVSTDTQLEIKSLRQEIAHLKRQLNQDAEEIAPIKASKDAIQEEDKVKKMTMTDFENQMKSSFTDQFKGVVLEMTGKRLDDIKASYNNTSQKNEWSNQYENQITNYLNENDHSGDHFLQSLNCNISVCRLEVNTNDEQGWDSLYAGIMQQPWYKSITIQENSDYPGYVVYYLPSFEN